MGKWHHHHMAGRIGKAIQNDEAVLSPINDFGFVIRQLGQLAEYALARFAVRLCSISDVGVTPRCPQIIHRMQSSRDRRGRTLLSDREGFSRKLRSGNAVKSASEFPRESYREITQFTNYKIS